MTSTQRKELIEKFIFFIFFIGGMSLLSIPIVKAWNQETEKINDEKERIKQSVKIHDYDDQKY
jgi:hypothetical protein